MGRSSTPSAWCSNTLRMLICDKATRRPFFLWSDLHDHYFAGQQAEAGLAIKLFCVLVVVQHLQFHVANASLAAKIFHFIERQRSHAVIAEALFHVHFREHALNASIL